MGFFSSPPLPGLWGPPTLLSSGYRGCETDHPPSSSAEVENAWSCISFPPIRLHGVVLRYAQGLHLFTFTLYETSKRNNIKF
jgi:hypothetical protein